MNKNVLWLILLIFIFLSFVTLFRNPLINDDAALYALGAKNAILYNQWLAQFVTPGDLSSFIDKPPLGIWLLAWFPRIFGINELTIHFPNVIYYLILLIILYFWIAKLSSKKIALYSTLISATSLCLIVYSRAPKLDVPLTLFVMTAHLSLYDFLKNNRPFSLILFSLSLTAGTLIKSGFGFLFPGLTILSLLLFNRTVRRNLIDINSLVISSFSILLFVLLVCGVIWAQRFALHDQWLPYLKSITIQSKYNVRYLGFGFHYSIIGFLLITIFPWSPLWLTSLKIPRLKEGIFQHSKLTLSDFCNLWFWSNILFLFFFYQQNDLRTFTVFVPPLAVLAAIKLTSISRKKQLGITASFIWNLIFLILFSTITIAVILNPVNPQGYSLKASILPFGLFTFSLLLFAFHLWKPTFTKLATYFLLVCFSYTILFYNTKPLADASNPNLTWPSIINKYRMKNIKFYIYRPPDRKLFYSPDLLWVDFIAGPADKYFWKKEELLKSLKRERAIVLSDTESWEKLKVTRAKTLAQDHYSILILQ